MSEELAKSKLGDVLRRYTSARVGLGQAGSAVPTREQLNFQLDHALARDAVHARMDVADLLQGLRLRKLACIALRSAVAGEFVQDERQIYLRRPDLGRSLHADSAEALRQLSQDKKPDVVFVIADGLTSLAAERHALHLLDAIISVLNQEQWSAGPVCVVSQGRVAIGDEIGHLLTTKLVVMMIGERPGLSAPDSLGVYLTWAPRKGRTDAERNCISNIRADGLSYADAAQRIVFYMNGARQLQCTGVALKENPALLLPAD